MPEWLVMILVALVAGAGGVSSARYGRIAKLERTLADAQASERVLWLYSRDLIDHIYRGAPPPPPAPPRDYTRGSRHET